jgi:Ca2+-binding RTX toxin-like protein
MRLSRIKIAGVISVFVACISGVTANQAVAKGIECSRPRLGDIMGTHRAERLIGSTADDVIYGLGGDDVIVGGGGNDLLCGGPGDDRIKIGPNSDWFDAAAGGGRGSDLLKALGSAWLYGDDGKDVIRGSDMSDRIEGGRGDDRIYAGDGAD